MRVHPRCDWQDDGRRPPFLELCSQTFEAIDKSGRSRGMPSLQAQQPGHGAILADDEHRRGLALAKGHLNREAADGCLRWF